MQQVGPNDPYLRPFEEEAERNGCAYNPAAAAAAAYARRTAEEGWPPRMRIPVEIVCEVEDHPTDLAGILDLLHGIEDGQVDGHIRIGDVIEE